MLPANVYVLTKEPKEAARPLKNKVATKDRNRLSTDNGFYRTESQHENTDTTSKVLPNPS
jgi:hypothetical protein